MSRIGKQKIEVPQGVEITIKKRMVTVKGPKGEMKQGIASNNIEVKIEDGVISLGRKNDVPTTRALHGLYRSLIANMVTGVTQGFQKKLELVGVGYRASIQEDLLDLSIGYSHNFVMQIPSDLKVSTTQEKGSNPTVLIEGIDKQLVGLVASKIRSLRKPEPYQGKGIRYAGEVIRRKAGKSASK